MLVGSSDLQTYKDVVFKMTFYVSSGTLTPTQLPDSLAALNQ